ncbi:vascular non-inflammatory molecule 3-like [Argiope bruennichi]|uniref:vascular non-inflammatory molecule 3-like n=1 Tax=Argiope bruennichi TaxID=94029 RepID=UPI00249531DC|nr:vascular non-inflammatory molecule 3-like [Argiope bruennichi]XP_055930908.1 vascular non-inflammatory molecule 3-like [Argiope bruennichi]
MLAFIFYLSLFFPATVLSRDYFTAAVFEHRLQKRDIAGKEPMEIKTANLQYFGKAVEHAAEKGADIILFNEYGTYMVKSRKLLKNFAEYVPDPKVQKFNPCIENAKDRTILYTVSCFARENNIYIVVNLVGYEPCEATCDAADIEDCETKCPDNGVFFFNTNAAFDREGNLIARYRKVHPYFREVVNAQEEPDFAVFDTEFGKFGMIVCFDLIFEEAVLLKDEYNIDTLLFPTYWFDDIVPLNAVEFQQSWAIANGVNLLSANTHAPGTGSMGSGIFSKDDGALVYTYEPNGKSKLLLANVRIKGNSEIPNISSIIEITPDSAVPITETGEKFPVHCYDKVVGEAVNLEIDYRCLKLKLEKYSLTKLEKPSGEVQSCYKEFCCTLSYSTQNLQDEYYLAVYNGFNDAFDYFHWWEEVCVLTRCDPYDGKPCVLESPRSNTVFEKVELKGNFKSKKIYPSVSTTNNRLAPKQDWTVKQLETETVLKYQPSSDLPLLKVALLGRRYEEDPEFVPYYPTQFKKDNRD